MTYASPFPCIAAAERTDASAWMSRRASLLGRDTCRGPSTMRIPSSRPKLCLAIDKVVFSWAISFAWQQIRWNSAFVPCTDRIPVGRGDLIETSQHDVSWLIQINRPCFSGPIFFVAGCRGHRRMPRTRQPLLRLFQRSVVKPYLYILLVVRDRLSTYIVSAKYILRL